MVTELRINDIYETISGEAGGFPQGTWVTIIRLQGCNLRCNWCDTTKGLNASEGELWTISGIRQKVSILGNKHIMITGGEPLCQPAVIELISALLNDDRRVVQVETNGSIPLPVVPFVHWSIDYKCPSSGMNKKMLPLEVFSYQLKMMRWAQNMEDCSCSVKFVVADDEDLECAVQVIRYLIQDHVIAPFLISPIDGNGSRIPEIAKKIKEKDADLMNYIIFSLQLHKIVDMP